ncbi:hypothetical protein LguiA_007016 [Lonicera macranthoides]
MCVLQKSESQRNGKQELLKAFERLGKVLPEEDYPPVSWKHGAEKWAEREVKRENKLLVKEWEKNQREVEKEKKREWIWNFRRENAKLQQDNKISLQGCIRFLGIIWVDPFVQTGNSTWVIVRSLKQNQFEELKLTTSKEMPYDDDLNLEKLVDG